MYEALYIEISIICLCILMLLLYKMQRQVDKQVENRKLSFVIFWSILLFVSDIIWALGEFKIIKFSRFANYTTNAFFMIMTGLITYSWLKYTDYKLRRKPFNEAKISNIIKIIPLIVLVGLCIVSYFNGCLIYVTKENIYKRGDYYIIQPIITYVYLFYGAGESIYYAIKSKNIIERNNCLVLASFIIFPVIGGLFQFVKQGLPTSSPGIVLAFLLIYINLQQQQISKDGLTKINNRRTFDEYVIRKVAALNKNDRLGVMFLDINSFKKINDSFGHHEGDKALIKVAEILKKVASEENMFLARYGGDEFVLVGDLEDSDQLLIVKNKINKQLIEYNQNTTVPYKLNVCIGISEYNQDTDTILRWISRADANLYEEKAQLMVNR